MGGGIRGAGAAMAAPLFSERGPRPITTPYLIKSIRAARYVRVRANCWRGATEQLFNNVCVH